MFGLEEMLSSTVSYDDFPFPPVQIMDALLEPILHEPPSSVPSVPLLQIPTPQPPTHTLIPLVGLLPVSWSFVDYSVDKAGKNDDAEPVFHHWEERITLILSHAANLINLFRRLCLQRLYRLLYLEFLSYLNHQHGLIGDSYLVYFKLPQLYTGRIFLHFLNWK